MTKRLEELFNLPAVDNDEPPAELVDAKELFADEMHRLEIDST